MGAWSREGCTRAPVAPIPHRSHHLLRKTWGPGAAAPSCVCRSPFAEEPAPEEGPAPPHLPAASLPVAWLRPGRAGPSYLPLFPVYPARDCIASPSRCAGLGDTGAPAPTRRRRRPPKAAVGDQDPRPGGGPASVACTRGLCLYTPSPGPPCLASPGVGRGKASLGYAAGLLQERLCRGGPQPLLPPLKPSSLLPS